MAILNTEAPSSFDVFQVALDLFISAENAQDLCRKLVHSDLFLGVVRGAHVYTLNTRSNLVETAGYGEPFAEGLNEISAWDENPASNAVRTKRDVFAPGETKASRSGIVAIPLI